MRVLQNSEIIHISGGIDVESTAKWGGKIGGALGAAAGSFGGFYAGSALCMAGVNPNMSLPILVPTGGLVGFSVGMYGGYLLGSMGAIGFNMLATSASYIYSF